MRLRALGILLTGQHAGKLLDPLVVAKKLNVTGREPPRGCLPISATHGSFRHADMLICEGRYLWQVCDHKDLDVPGEHGQPSADFDGGTPTHAGVHFIEDERGGRDPLRQELPRLPT